MKKAKNKIENFLNDKFDLSSIQLKKITAEKVIDGFKNETELVKNYEYKIISTSEKEIALEVLLNISFSPNSLFRLESIIEVKYRVKEVIDKEELDKNIGSLVEPCGPILSLITSFISEKIIGSPIVIPPIISLKTKNE